MQEGRRKPIFREGALAVEVAAEHGADLRHGDVAFIAEDQRVFGEVFKERRRRLARLAAGQIARIVFNAGAGAGRRHHLKIELHALFEALRFQAAFLPRA